MPGHVPISQEFGTFLYEPYRFKVFLVVHDDQDSSSDRSDTDAFHEFPDARILVHIHMYVAHVQFQSVLLVAQSFQCNVRGRSHFLIDIGENLQQQQATISMRGNCALGVIIPAVKSVYSVMHDVSVRPNVPVKFYLTYSITASMRFRRTRCISPSAIS